MFRYLREGQPDHFDQEPEPEQKIDIFLSYKSEQSEDIRLLAEALMAHGLSVWFDEYRINPFSRPEFAAKIESGIDRSAYFIFFDSPSYAASEYCQHELNRVKSRSDLWPGRVLRILDPEVSRLPRGLSMEADVPTFVASTNYPYSNILNETLKVIGDLLGKSLSVTNRETYAIGPDSRIELTTQKFVATLTMPNWTRLYPARAGDGIVRPIACVLRHPRAKIQCSIQMACIGRQDGHSYSGERDKIESAIKLMAEKNRRWGWKIIGLHPLMIRGRSHLAATVDTRTDKMMHRYYMFFVGREKLGGEFEDVYVYFDFYFRGERSDFFHAAHAFDDVVYASRWRKKRQRMRNRVVRH